MVFNDIYGEINFVPIEHYEKLISTYVEVVKNVKGVKSIIQIGSFTAPGLSDIDIIVIVDDDNPPSFSDISLKKILHDEEFFEVVVHDVFIYPESLSKYIEGLFYLDRKNILYGNDIGGSLPLKTLQELKLILSFEYAVNRLETLIILTSLPKNSLRDILLYISTLRHTYKLLNHFNIISNEECNSRIKRIEALRTKSLNNNSDVFREELNSWITPSFIAIYQSVLQLGEMLKVHNSKTEINSYVLNNKKLIFSINEVNIAKEFFIKNKTKNNFFKAKVLIEPMPSIVYEHVAFYKSLNYSSNVEIDSIKDSLSLRYYLASSHKAFLTKRNYPIASSYIILDEKAPKIQDRIKSGFLKALQFYKSFR